jgi:hypothetical protein
MLGLRVLPDKMKETIHLLSLDLQGSENKQIDLALKIKKPRVRLNGYFSNTEERRALPMQVS